MTQDVRALQTLLQVELHGVVLPCSLKTKNKLWLWTRGFELLEAVVFEPVRWKRELGNPL